MIIVQKVERVFGHKLAEQNDTSFCKKHWCLHKPQRDMGIFILILGLNQNNAK